MHVLSPKFKKTIWVAVLLVATLFVYHRCAVAIVRWNRFSDPVAVHETQVRGDVIVTALKSYHQIYNKYPSSLADLIPEFLERLPETTAGDGVWYYDLRKFGQGFCLYFTDNFFGEESYYREEDSERWYRAL